MSPGPLPQFDRQHVLASAMDLFWEQGYEATGMTQLLEHVGIGRQSFYNTFGDKRSLYIEALENYGSSCVNDAITLLEAPGSPLGNVRKLCKAWEEEARDPSFRGCMFGNAAAEFGRDDPAIAKCIEAGFDRAEKAFREAFERAKEAGEIPKGTNTRDLARAFVCTAQGLAVMGQIREDKLAFTRSVTRALMALIPSND